MNEKIIVQASEVWGYFQDEVDDLKVHMHQIAGNPEYGVAIFVTEDSGLPSIVVTADDVQVYEETAVSAHDCQRTVEKVYDMYLTSKAIDYLTAIGDSSSDLTAIDIEDMIDERESELDTATYEFLLAAVQDAYIDDYATTDFDDIVDDLKEHFLEYMARKHGIPVYRPMMLEYEDGSEELSEYPYEDMEFDDPDNPLYKI